MNIIPVIDLLDGVVVHAKQGLRHAYQPIQSGLTASSKPMDIVNALLDMHPFQTLYIADLNAILQRPCDAHTDILDGIMQRYPTTQLWLDAGRATSQQLNARISSKNCVPVLGTESFSGLYEYRQYQQSLNSNTVLSLDFMPTGYQGPAELLANTDDWPMHVIAMTLSRVGTNSGVNLDLLQALLKQTTHQHLYAAGGIRNCNDLAQLHGLGIHGTLVASALHNKQITANDLTAFST